VAPNVSFLIANSPASITSKSPSSTNIVIDEPKNKIFSISYSDLEGDTVSIKWLQNGTLKSTNASYTFTGSYSTAGVYNITVVLNDTYELTTNYWKLTVDDKSQTTTEEETTVVISEETPIVEEEESEEEIVEEEQEEVREIEYSNEVVSGETIEFLFEEGLTEINKINLITKSDSDIVFVTTTKLEEKPEELAEIETLVYSYIEITAENADVETAEIHFIIEKSWIEENNFTKDSVRLLRFNESWNELPTGLVNEGEENIEYEAITPGFSIFAISAGIETKEAEIVTSSILNTNMPQIEGMRYLIKVLVSAVSIVLVLLFGLLLLMKYKK
jgi:PGF-pre-PGF domain-containing protein